MNDIKSIILIVTITIILIKIVKFAFLKILEKNNKIHLRFFKNFIVCIIVIFAVYSICSKFKAFEDFSAAILTSSSLLVVVLGFAFQTSLEDFIAGILISIFKPFNIGDRVNLVNSKITGYIEDITIRHTIIRTFQNSRLIIPNSVMNKEIIENSHIVDTRSVGFLDLLVSYETDIDLAKQIIIKVIKNNNLIIDQRNEEDKSLGKPQITIFIRGMTDNGIQLRTSIWTQSIDDNFLACSQIREEIIKEFKLNNIKVPYPKTQILK